MTHPLLAEKEYFSIGDVSEITGVKPYVLRYWESQFGSFRPPRRDSGQRKFTRKDVDTALQIKELLYDKRFTIEGAKKHLREAVKRGPKQMSLELGEAAGSIDLLRDAKKDVMDLLKSLKSTDYATAETL